MPSKLILIISFLASLGAFAGEVDPTDPNWIRCMDKVKLKCLGQSNDHTRFVCKIKQINICNHRQIERQGHGAK